MPKIHSTYISFYTSTDLLFFQAYKVLQELPVITVQAVVQFDGASVPITVSKGGKKVWVDLPPAKDMALVLTVTRENRFPRDLKAYAPKFSKVYSLNYTCSHTLTIRIKKNPFAAKRRSVVSCPWRC
jgi:hypothetical protein